MDSQKLDSATNWLRIELLMEAEVGPSRSEPMTWTEICERYPDKWVALVEIDWVNDTDFAFRSACVVGHGNRREQYEQARAWSSRYPSMGHFFTGRVRVPMSPLVFK